MKWFVLVIGLYVMLFQSLHGLNIPLSTYFHTEQTSIEFLISTATDRLRRDTTVRDGNLPDRTLLRLKIGGAFQELYLEKNKDIDIANIPVFTSKGGEIHRVHLTLAKEQVLYQAPGVGGSVLITRNTSQDDRQVFGSFYHNSSLYVIQPSLDTKVKGEGHVVSRVPDQKLVFESLPLEEISVKNHQQESNRSNHSNRRHDNHRRRRQMTSYNVEIFSVVDFKRYQFWYSMTSGSNRHSDTIQLVMQYLAYTINAVDMRYKTITGENFVFNMLSSGVYIADTPEASPWSEDNVVDGKVLSGATLDSFTSWIQQQDNLPQFDHAMGFTGYNVISGRTEDSAGIAFTKSLCTDTSTSIIEDNSFNFVTMTTAAHELGHSLGGQHDGIDNSCNGNDNHIMASVNRIVNDPSIGQNLWSFSTCSVQEFKTYISTLDSSNRNCMLKTSGSSRVPTTPRPMSDTYGPDETCVLRFGEGSYVCRSIQNYETICTGMYCNQPGTSQCYSTIPAEGTPCGKRKWCQQGRCVTSSLAQNNNEDNCALGDRPGLFDNTGKTCAQLIEDDPGKCYGDYTGSNCCGSCNSKKTDDTDCEYGDYSRSFCTSMTRYGCYGNENYCCATCKQLKNSSLPGCEYGDKFSGCSKNSCNIYNEENLAGCCETCFDPTKTVKPPPATTSTVRTTTTSTTSTTSSTSTSSTTSTSTSTTTNPTSATTTSSRSTVQTDISNKTTKFTSRPEDTTTRVFFTSTQTTPRGKSSDLVLIAVGSAVGVVVVIILVAIVCVCVRRRKAKMTEASGGRKASRDNAYDNIGFVSAKAEKPQHPPPRRGGQLSSEQNASIGSVTLTVNTVSDGTIVILHQYNTLLTSC